MTKPRTKRIRPRAVGRPSARTEADIRVALIAAAKRLFLKYGFEKVTARQIATEAGTTPAMIHYYFENKMGLFAAMLAEAIAPFTRMLTGAVEAGNQGSNEIASLVGGHMRIAAANSWIASLLVHDVLPEGGKFRPTFIRDIAARMLPTLVQLIEQGRSDGKFRADIDPRLTALSIISLSVFPLISRPVTAPILGFKLEGEDLEHLIAHTTKLLLHGIAARKTT